MCSCISTAERMLTSQVTGVDFASACYRFICFILVLEASSLCMLTEFVFFFFFKLCSPNTCVVTVTCLKEWYQAARGSYDISGKIAMLNSAYRHPKSVDNCAVKGEENDIKRELSNLHTWEIKKV